MGFESENSGVGLSKENIMPAVNRHDAAEEETFKPKAKLKVEDDENVFMVLYKDPETLADANRTIYLSRHGESTYNLYGRIGGNSGLSPGGLKYAKRLADHFEGSNLSNLKVWTSELVRTGQTALHFRAPKSAVGKLNELDSGDFDGMTYEGIAEMHPADFASRDRDKLRYRYPNGESYVDVCRRLLDVLPLMNRSQNLLVVSHQAVLRCIYAYLMNLSMEELPYVKIPLHTLMKVTFDGSRNAVHHTFMNVECVDTHRAKPDDCGSGRNILDALVTVPKHL